MTPLLDEALAGVWQLPAQEQDEIARHLIETTRSVAAAAERRNAGGGMSDDERADAFRLWPKRNPRLRAAKR